MKDDSTYEVFNILSRIIIIFSVVILLVGIIMRFNSSKSINQSHTTNVKSLISPKPQEQVKIGTIAAELNLKGPFICHFSSNEATMSGYINNKMVFAQIQNTTKTTNMLLNGDCVYFWQENSHGGEKLCGLGSYVSILGNMPLGNLLGGNQFMSLLGNRGQNQSKVPLRLDHISQVLESCKKEEIKDQAIFMVPKEITFTEKKAF